MSMRGDDIGGFWSTGIWVGLRIFLVPSIVAAGFFLYQNPGAGGLPQIDNPVSALFEDALAQVDGALGGGSARSSWLTPGPGAKWVRP